MSGGAPNPVDVHVGHRLRQRRTLLGISQEQLGASLGLTFQQVQKYERGMNRIGASRLYGLACALDVPVGFFFQGLAAEPGMPAWSMSPSMGLAEEPNDFVFDRASSAPERVAAPDAVESRETLEMVRAFNRIRDPQLRRRLLELGRALADMAGDTSYDRK